MMSFRRIQKLLYSSEYGELEDIVILESPFAEITPEGKGIRQVQIALTPTKLILAQDVFDENTHAEKSKDDKKINLETVKVSPDLDAEIESLELVSIIPINLVSLSLFVQGRKRAVKARLRNGQVFYFELGGSRHRKMLWKLWSDKVKSMSPGAPISLSSETTNTDSSSHANACIKRKCCSTTSSHKSRPSKLNDKCPKDMKILKSFKTKLPSRRKPWTDRNLFPTEIDDDGKGESFGTYKPSKAEELPKNLLSHEQCKGDSADKSDDKFSWSLSRQVELNLINERQMTSVIPRRKKIEKKESQRSILVHRFDSGVSENCGLGLYLAPLDGAKDEQFKELSFREFSNLTDSGVRMWEECSDARRKRKSYSLHSCDLVAFPHFYNGLGPTGNHISVAEKCLLQLRRTKSVFQLNDMDSNEKCLPVPKCQLTATISYDNLTLPFIEEGEQKRYEKLLRKFPCSPSQLTGIHFWMPDLSYQSSSANNIYHKQRRILKNLHGQKICSQDKSKKISTIPGVSINTIYRRNSSTSKPLNEGDKARRKKYNTVYEKEIRRKICISGEENFGCEYCSCKLTGSQNQDMDRNNLTSFQSMLKFHVKIFAQDFTSTTLAYQLTMIDRDLFLQIPVSELGLIIYQKYHLKEKSFLYPFASLHNGTPCISALISFSHRISCLVSSAVLEGESLKDRARSIVHFINIAHKCFQLQNFQSCRSILFGLQSPAIFRLRETWKHVKRKNYNKYQTFRHLCRFYINVQMTGYSCISKNSRRIPFLPCISFILNYLQETKSNIEIVSESYIAKSSKGSEQKIKMDIQNAIDDDVKRGKRESDLLNNEDAEGNVPKAHRSKFISFLSTVFRINRTQKNSKRRFSGTVNKLPEQSPKAAMDNYSKGKSNDCFSLTDINDNTLKLYFSSVGKDWSSSEILDQEKHSNFLREVRYTHECAHENRMKIFKRTAETLVSSQYCAYNYALPQSDLAKEYILKAKYKEHLQNYKLSLQVENS